VWVFERCGAATCDGSNRRHVRVPPRPVHRCR
jgi:hypothetical protein